MIDDGSISFCYFQYYDHTDRNLRSIDFRGLTSIVIHIILRLYSRIFSLTYPLNVNEDQLIQSLMLQLKTSLHIDDHEYSIMSFMQII